MSVVIPEYLLPPAPRSHRGRVPAGARKAVSASVSRITVSVELGGDCPEIRTAGSHMSVNYDQMYDLLGAAGLPIFEIDGPWPAFPGLMVTVQVDDSTHLGEVAQAVRDAAAKALIHIKREF